MDPHRLLILGLAIFCLGACTQDPLPLKVSDPSKSVPEKNETIDSQHAEDKSTPESISEIEQQEVSRDDFFRVGTHMCFDGDESCEFVVTEADQSHATGLARTGIATLGTSPYKLTVPEKVWGEFEASMDANKLMVTVREPSVDWSSEKTDWVVKTEQTTFSSSTPERIPFRLRVGVTKWTSTAFFKASIAKEEVAAIQNVNRQDRYLCESSLKTLRPVIQQLREEGFPDLYFRFRVGGVVSTRLSVSNDNVITLRSLTPALPLLHEIPHFSEIHFEQYYTEKDICNILSQVRHVSMLDFHEPPDDLNWGAVVSAIDGRFEGIHLYRISNMSWNDFMRLPVDHLKSLNVAGTEHLDFDLIGRLKSLKYLGFSEHVSDSITTTSQLRLLMNMPELKSLFLPACKLEQIDIETLLKFPSLDCLEVSTSTLADIKSLSKLSLSEFRCVKISGSGDKNLLATQDLKLNRVIVDEEQKEDRITDGSIRLNLNWRPQFTGSLLKRKRIRVAEADLTQYVIDARIRILEALREVVYTQQKRDRNTLVRKMLAMNAGTLDPENRAEYQQYFVEDLSQIADSICSIREKGDPPDHQMALAVLKALVNNKGIPTESAIRIQEQLYLFGGEIIPELRLHFDHQDIEALDEARAAIRESLTRDR